MSVQDGLRYRQVHLDFHTSEHIVSVGERFDPDEFADTLARAHVDSVTCFSRCHHGWIYHDTRFPARHPGLVRNLLAEQIAACHARGIRVPIYITVGWDERVAREHSEWLEITPEGRIAGASPLQAGWRRLCFNTPYIEYVLAQTAEVMELFPVDGLFFDIMTQGECCCPRCLDAMHGEGFDPLEKEARVAFAAQVLARTKQRIHDLVCGYEEDCTIFFNAGHVGPSIRPTLGLYSHLELESLPTGGWGYDHLPATVRYARNLGRPLLAMTGRFHRMWGDFGGYKNPAALEFECFSALAEGAGCSVGDQLHPTGQINQVTYDLIGDVYAQVAAREPWCRGAKAVAEIGVFTPEGFGTADAHVDSSLAGALHMLRETHYQVDVVDPQSELGRYRVLILPDKIPVADALAERLVGFVAAGGSLILSHRSGLHPETGGFAVDFGCRLKGSAPFSPDYLVAGAPIGVGIGATQHVMYSQALAIEPSPETQVWAQAWQPYFNRDYRHFCSHRQAPPEKPAAYPAVVRQGRIVYFAHPIFGMYLQHGVRVYRQLVINVLRQTLPEKLVEAQAPTTARITLMQQGERHVLHILHYIPERRARDLDIIEDVIPLYGVSLELLRRKPPTRVYLAPQDVTIEWEWWEGRARCTVPEVRGHQMVVFE